MRIFLEAATNGLCNVGDIAMLQGAVDRLRRLCPEAEITVATMAVDQLGQHCDNVVALSNERRWRMDGRFIVRRGFQKVSRAVGVGAHGMHLIYLRRPLVRAFRDAICAADLVACVGGGNLTDAFPFTAQFFLQTLEAAATLGKPAVMLGQGMGPIQSPVLRKVAGAILPRADLIAVREGRAGPALLHSLGVSQRRVFVTGDDAVEKAFAARRDVSGEALGVNLRLSDYSCMGSSDLPDIRAALDRVVVRRGIEIVPVPIKWGVDSDVQSIRSLLRGSSGGAGMMEEPPCSTSDTIARVGRCRTVFTGSYHAAVFALSQGIPAVCLARSAYYVDKFLGLQDMFGSGCEVLLMDMPGFSGVLSAALERALDQADAVRPLLQQAACSQIEAAHAFDMRVRELLAAR